MATSETFQRLTEVACAAYERGERMKEVVASVFGITEANASKRMSQARQAGWPIPHDHTGRHRPVSYSYAALMAELRVVERTFDAAEWRVDAACRNHPTDLFFPPHGVSHQQFDAVRTICQQCPVIEDCLQYALENNERHGIWGGLSERQRRQLRRQTRTNITTYLTKGNP